MLTSEAGIDVHDILRPVFDFSSVFPHLAPQPIGDEFALMSYIGHSSTTLLDASVDISAILSKAADKALAGGSAGECAPLSLIPEGMMQY
jgi:hypothetical protein